MKKKFNIIFNIFLCICVFFATLYTCPTNIKANETTYYYDYTNNAQTFTAPTSGKYYIEAYGGSGGGATTTTTSGYGGFVSGYINLKQGEIIYIYVGGSGQQTTTGAKGGYNGGGNSSNAAGSGGGATHIAKVSGLLNTLENNKDDIIAVAAGGGGQSSTKYTYGKFGCGGGLVGLNSKDNPFSSFVGWNSTMYLHYAYYSGGRQDYGYAFGQGSDSCNTYNYGYAGAGGGGWYGGNTIPSYLEAAMGGGGSSYIGGLYDATTTSGLNYGNGVVSITYCGEMPVILSIDTNNGGIWDEQEGKINISSSYNSTINLNKLVVKDGYEFLGWRLLLGNGILDNTNNTITLNEENVILKAIWKTPLVLESTQTNNVLDLSFTQDDEYEKFYKVFQSEDKTNWTYLNNDVQTNQTGENIWEYNYTGKTQEFIAPNEGSYKLEVYGAQGGQSTYGGLGGYSTGTIYLKKGQKLYINVGQQPTNIYGGWNGGSIAATDSGHGTYYGGGGATDISLYGTTNTTTWNTTNHLYSRIIVAGGGGGGGTYKGWAYGGSGGGLTGGSSSSSGNGPNRGEYAYGGTQTSGGQAAGANWGPGINGSFGYAGSSNSGWGSGSGGGWYGGGGGGHTSDRVYTGSGGSGYTYDINSYVNYPSGCLLNEDFYMIDTSMQNGVRRGHGYAKITCIEVSYKSNSINDIVLEDTIKPSIPQNIKITSKDTTTTNIEWTPSIDYGNTYYYKVCSYMNDTKELIQTSNIIKANAVSNIKGYYYYLDNSINGTVTSNHNFVETNSLVLSNNSYNYLHIAAVDNYGNISDTYTTHLSNISLSGTITWNDENNIYNSRPTTLNVYLYCNGEKIQTITLEGDTNVWSYNFSGLNVYDSNNNICDYKVKFGFDELTSENNQWEYLSTYNNNGYNATIDLSPIFHNVVCKDYVNDENGQLLGTSDKQYQYGSTAYGSDWGNSIETNEYYIGYKYDSCTSKIVDSDIVVYRFFKASTYTVVFDGNGETSGDVDNKEYIYNSSYNLPYNAFEKTGYTFLNWNTRANGTGISYKENEEIDNLCNVGTDSIALYANWKINQYEVTYIDVIDSVEGFELGRTTQMVDYGKVVNGSDLPNTNSEPNAIYQKYIYQKDTSATVTTNGAIVYRIFNLAVVGKPINVKWNDDNNINNIRPKNITINVFSNSNKVGTYNFDTNNTNVYIIENLQQYDDNGNEIEYTYSLSDINGYVFDIQNDMITCTSLNVTMDNNSNNKVNVYVTQASTFSVTIPKTIILSGETKEANYQVLVKGNIGGQDRINVIPDNSFVLQQYGKNDIYANVTQEKTIFDLNDIMTSDITTTTNGTIIAPNMTAGSWSGSFNFNIKFFVLETTNSIGSVKEDIINKDIIGQDKVQDKYTTYTYGIENE